VVPSKIYLIRNKIVVLNVINRLKRLGHFDRFQKLACINDFRNLESIRIK
jgi:hypothetical protein